MDDDELELEVGFDEQNTLDAILEAAVAHTRTVNAALERGDTTTADDAEGRREAIIPTDSFELRDPLDTAIEYLAIEQEENDDLRNALKADSRPAEPSAGRRERIADITDFGKTLLIEAHDAKTAGKVIYGEERAKFIEVLDEGVGFERRTRHIRRHRSSRTDGNRDA